MILNTGQRTDIPAFFPEWFANRIKEGFTKIVVISFVDLYEKVKRNFPQAREVSQRDKLHIAEQKSWVDNQQELGFE